MKTREKRRFDPVEHLVQAGVYIFIISLCAVIILPCLNIVALAFNDGADAARGGVYFWPRAFTLDNFKSMFKDGKIMTAYRITILRTAVGTVLSLGCISLAAYALKEQRLPGRKQILFFITLTMLFSGGLIPTYIQYKNLNLLNSFWVYVVPSLMSVIYMMMMRATFESLPDSLVESAQLDGCGHFRIYLQIVMPLSKAVIAVVALRLAVGHWNDWFSGAFYMQTAKMWPVQTVLQQMLARAMSAREEVTTVSEALAKSNSTVTSDALKMAAVIITTAPILCVYPFAQKYFAQGALVGAVKG